MADCSFNKFIKYEVFNMTLQSVSGREKPLIVSNDVFKLLKEYFDSDIYNPYRIQTEDGQFIDLYIEDLYSNDDF